MSAEATAISARVLELRRQFDRSFIEPLANDAERTEDFLAVHAGGEPQAIRVAQIAALHAGVKVTECPSYLPEMIGLAAFRGRLTPIYDLGLLLGLARSGARWMVVAARGEAAYAFDSFDDHFRAPAASLAGVQDEHGASILISGSLALPVVDLIAIAAALRRRLPSPTQHGVT